MINVFLSASVPLPTRHPKFFATADIVSIREAVKALAGEVIPRGILVFGGHPAITPLIALLLRGQGLNASRRVVLYQSAFFSDYFIEEADQFVDIRIVPAKRTKRSSIDAMRIQMMEETKFDAGVFIGGMDGVVEEFDLFKKMHGQAKAWPIASTGGAAKQIFDDRESAESKLLAEEITYPTLFRTLLNQLN